MMLEQLLPISLAALAVWCGWTVVRTAIELHRELVPVRIGRARTRRIVRNGSSVRLRRTA